MAIRPLIRFEVFKRDDFTCRYCGRKTPEAVLQIDHVIPVSAGGLDEIANLVTSCSICNLGKSDRSLTVLPNTADVHERAVLLAEQERQVSEYNYWRARRRAREDSELSRLEDLWMGSWRDRVKWKGGREVWEWRGSSVRLFLQKLGYHEVLEVMEYVLDLDGCRSEGHGWGVFCKVNWGRIKDRARDPGGSSVDDE